MSDDSVTWDEILKLADRLEDELRHGPFDSACALHLARAVLVFNRRMRGLSVWRTFHAPGVQHDARRIGGVTPMPRGVPVRCRTV